MTPKKDGEGTETRSTAVATGADDRPFSIALPSKHHRVVFAAMVEKFEKGALATKNTCISFGGDPHSFDAVLAVCGDFRRQAATQADMFAGSAEAVESAVRSTRPGAEGTPLGDAIDAALKGPDGAAAGQDGVSWTAAVPKPRPAIGQLVRWPTGQTQSIKSALGYLSDKSAFHVMVEDKSVVDVVAHKGTDGVEWWLLTQLLDYREERIIPAAPVTEEVLEKARKDALPSDATPAEKVTKTPKAGHPGPVAEGVKKAPNAQQQRNAAAAGVSRPVSPAPKPSAKKAGGK